MVIDLLPSLRDVAGAATGGIWGLIALCVLWIVRQRPAMQSLHDKSEAVFRDDLLGRIRELENKHAADLAAMQARCDANEATLRREMERSSKVCDEKLKSQQRQINALIKRISGVELDNGGGK